MQDYVTIPIDQEGDENLEPLIHDELRQILDNTPNQRRKAFYMVLKNTGCRISEGLQLKKKLEIQRLRIYDIPHCCLLLFQTMCL